MERNYESNPDIPSLNMAASMANSTLSRLLMYESGMCHLNDMRGIADDALAGYRSISCTPADREDVLLAMIAQLHERLSVLESKTANQSSEIDTLRAERDAAEHAAKVREEGDITETQDKDFCAAINPNTREAFVYNTLTKEVLRTWTARNDAEFVAIMRQAIAHKRDLNEAVDIEGKGGSHAA